VQGIVLYGNDGAANTATGDDLVAIFQVTDHLLPAFLPLLLRKNHEQVEDGKDENQREEGQTHAATGLKKKQVYRVLNHLARLQATHAPLSQESWNSLIFTAGLPAK